MKRRATGMAARRNGLGQRVAGILAGLALALVPVFGQSPAFSLAQGQPAPANYHLPSESTAVALAVLGTAAAVASVFSENGWVFIGALTLGPSVGFLYGGCWARGLISSALRLGITAAAVIWVMEDDESATPGYLWLGAMATSAVFDILTVKGAVHKRNESIMARQGVKVGVSPFALPKGGGIQLQLSF